MLLEVDIWRCCSGPENTIALGMSGHVRRLLEADIWRCYSGPGSMVVPNKKPTPGLP